jgi:hypothetical protein
MNVVIYSLVKLMAPPQVPVYGFSVKVHLIRLKLLAQGFLTSTPFPENLFLLNY